jgi:hypothetical protein
VIPAASQIFVFSNTKDDGPVVLDLPPAAKGASLLGAIADAWQVPLTDVGFEGSGGKYLVLSPDYTGEVPAGYIPVRSKTYNTFPGMRLILASNSEEDEQKGAALVKQIKIYLFGWFISWGALRSDGRTEVFQGSRQYVGLGTGALPPSFVAMRM